MLQDLLFQAKSCQVSDINGSHSWCLFNFNAQASSNSRPHGSYVTLCTTGIHSNFHWTLKLVDIEPCDTVMFCSSLPTSFFRIWCQQNLNFVMFWYALISVWFLIKGILSLLIAQQNTIRTLLFAVLNLAKLAKWV